LPAGSLNLYGEPLQFSPPASSRSTHLAQRLSRVAAGNAVLAQQPENGGDVAPAND